MLWLYPRQKFNTDIDVQKQIGVILSINSFCDNWKSFQALKNVLQTIQNFINAINMYDSDSIMSWCNPIPSFANTPRRFILVEIFGINSYLNTIMWRMMPLDCCFNNIQLVLLTTFIIYTLLLNVKLTWIRHITKISTLVST